MAPKEDDDPVTAEYDVFLTPPNAEEVLLLQYPNRSRYRPYNAANGTQPVDVQIKPLSGHLEVDVSLAADQCFNKYEGLKWGDVITTSKDLHNKSGTFGAAAGFHGPKPRGVTARTALKDQTDREMEVERGLTHFFEAEGEGKVLSHQVLGGQIKKHDQDETGKPMYFVGAFRKNQLHLTKVNGTVQLRPQFHHLDAEDERARLAASRAAALDGDTVGTQNNPRSLLQRAKTENEAERGRQEDHLKRALQSSEAEEWMHLAYVDEGRDEAFEKFHERMFIKNTGDVARLKSSMTGEEYVDAISAPRRQSPNRTRRRQPRKKKGVTEAEDVSDHGEDAAMGEAA